jgi:hypothetical protein
MKITIETSAEQDAAITRSNQESNAGGIIPPDSEFAASLFLDLAEAHVQKWKRVDAIAVSEKIRLNFDKISPEDLAAVQAIIAKTDAADVAVGPSPAVLVSP